MNFHEGLIKALPDVILVVNERGEIIFVGGQCDVLLGYEAEELVGKPVEVLVPARYGSHREHRAAFHNARSVRPASDRPVLRARHKNGEEIEVEIGLSPLSDPGGAGQLVVAAIHDASRQAGTDNRMRIQTVALQAAANGILITDRAGVITWVNAAAARLTGYAPEELVGQSTRILRSGHHDEGFYRDLWQTVLRGGTWFGEIVNRRKDGSLYREEQTIAPVADDTGAITHFIAIKQDVTVRWRAAEQLRESNEALERARAKAEAADQAKSAFLSSMSHELRTPLNAILGYVQLLDRDTSLTTLQRDHVDAIRRSGEHLLRLINEVLSISRIEAGKVTLSEGAFELPALAWEVWKMMRFRVEEKGLGFAVAIAPHVPEVARGDEEKIRQILLNLVGNAVKFTESGRIAIRVDWNDGIGEFEVEDTGVGIGGEELHLLFKPFAQTESGRRSKQGTGLGLAISQSLARAMDGEIIVTSAVARGTSFVLRVPLAIADRSEIPSHPRRVVGLEPGQRDFRILVVDDVPDNRNVLTSLLAPLGFLVNEGASGSDAVADWSAWRPDLIFMDVRMPMVGGLDATRAIRREESDHAATPCRIVAVSAGAFDEERADALEAGCDDFIVKPFRQTEIFDAIARHLDVRYVYDTIACAGTDAPDDDVIPLRPEQLRALPADLRESLRVMAILGDATAIQAIAERVRDYDDLTARKLRSVARRYAFDDILDALGE